MQKVKNISDWNLKWDKIEYPEMGLTHELWETTDEEIAFFAYNIGEYGLMKHACKLRILNDKKNPQLIYDSLKVSFIYDGFTENDWSDKGLFVLRQLKDGGYKAPVIIVRLKDLQFLSIDKFHVKLDLNANILTIIESLYDKAGKTTKEIVEQFDLEKENWKPLKLLTN